MKTLKSCLACLAILAIVLMSSQALAALQKDDITVSFPDQVMKDKNGNAKIMISIHINGTNLDTNSVPIDITIYNDTYKIISEKKIYDAKFFEDYQTSILLNINGSGTVPYYLMITSNHHVIISKWNNVTVSEYSNKNVKIAINVGFVSLIAVIVIIAIISIASTKYVLNHHKMHSKISVSEFEAGDTEINIHT